MVPLQAHEQVDCEVRAVCSAMVTPSAPLDHGLTTTGVHGAGVSAPMAAAVAAATAGFASVLQAPKGAMFTIGRKSATVAAGKSSASALLAGSVVSVDGATPSLHRSVAPCTTSFAIPGVLLGER